MCYTLLSVRGQNSVRYGKLEGLVWGLDTLK